MDPIKIMAELLRWHIDCHDEELKEMGIERSDLLSLARLYEQKVGGPGSIGWEDRQQAVKMVIAAYKEGKKG